MIPATTCLSGHDPIADIGLFGHLEWIALKGERMSVDFYVALPADEWPTTAAVEQCLRTRQYPVQLKRFPKHNPKVITTDGILATVDGGPDTYLEGEVFSAPLVTADVRSINDKIASTGDPFRISNTDIVVSMRIRSPGEMRAASYLISSFIFCFRGYGFELQRNAHGRDDFARSLLLGADALKGL